MKVIPGGIGFNGDEAVAITPIGECPDFKIHVKRLPAARSLRIADINRVNVKDPEFVGIHKATLDSAKASILNWEGEETVFKQPVPFSLDNIETVAMARVLIKEGSEGVPPVWETIWWKVQQKLDEAQAIETKN